MTIIYLGIAWMVGVWLASMFNLPWELWSLIALVTLLAAVLFRKKTSLRLLILMATLLCLGALRLTLPIPDFDEELVAYFNGHDPITLTGTTVRDPEIRDRSQDLRLRAEPIELPDGTQKAVSGLVLVTVHLAQLFLTGPECVHLGSCPSQQVTVTLTIWRIWRAREYTARCPGPKFRFCQVVTATYFIGLFSRSRKEPR